MSNDIEESNLKIFSTILLDSENNSLILPFNYHKLFDMDIIWFDEFGNMNFNKDLYDNFESGRKLSYNTNYSGGLLFFTS